MEPTEVVRDIFAPPPLTSLCPRLAPVICPSSVSVSSVYFMDGANAAVMLPADVLAVSEPSGSICPISSLMLPASDTILELPVISVWLS